MKKKSLIVIIICSIIVSAIAYVIYDSNFLYGQDRGKYDRVVTVIRAELKMGKSAEEIVEYLKNNAVRLEIISITPVYNSTSYDKFEQKTVKGFGVSCRVRSIIGMLSGYYRMNVDIDEQSNTITSYSFTGM